MPIGEGSRAVRPSRRRFLIGGAAGAAVAWTAPTILSVDAAAAATTFTRLFGVSGEGGGNPQSLWSIDRTTGVPTFELTFQAVTPGITDGEALASLGTDLYRLSGRTTGQVLDVVAFPGFAVASSTPSGDTYGEAGGLTAFGSGFLMAESFNIAQRQLFSMSTTGVMTLIGPIDHRNKGLALNLAGTVLYGVDNANPPNLKILNPATGATISTIPMTGAPGLQGATGLATHPDSGQLYTLLSFGAGTPRTLATVDPVTGATTNIGVVDDGTGPLMSGLAFLQG